MILLLGQVPTDDPRTYSPLALVAVVVMFLLWRLKATDADDRKRIIDCETQNELLRDEVAEQRSAKHAALNRETRAVATLDLVARLAPSCTCHALDPVLPLLDRRKKDE